MANYGPSGIGRLARLGRALGDEGRIRALMALSEKEMCACHIVALLRLAPSTVSKHMAVLQRAGLVSSRRSGRWVYYRAAGKGALGEIRKALDRICRCTAPAKAAICRGKNGRDIGNG
jgi:DNA-binding transcriptional ArsR family regulator